MEKQRKKRTCRCKYTVDKTTTLGNSFQEINKVVFLENIKLHFQIINKKSYVQCGKIKGKELCV